MLINFKSLWPTSLWLVLRGLFITRWRRKICHRSIAVRTQKIIARARSLWLFVDDSVIRGCTSSSYPMLRLSYSSELRHGGILKNVIQIRPVPTRYELQHISKKMPTTFVKYKNVTGVTNKYSTERKYHMNKSYVILSCRCWRRSHNSSQHLAQQFVKQQKPFSSKQHQRRQIS